MLKKLRRRFIILIMIIVLIGVSVVFALMYATTRQGLVQQSQSTLDLLLSEHVFNKRPGQTNGGRDVRIPYFSVHVNSFNEITLEQSEYYELDDELLIEIVSATYEREQLSGELKDYSLRYSMRSGAFGVDIAYVDTTFEASTLRSLVINFALMGMGALVVFFFLSLLISKQIMKPIVVAWEQQRQFVADASHELKTPLTVISANAEMLTDDTAAEPEQKKKWIENIKVESDRMRRLVETLLDQAKADSGEEQTLFSEVDMSYTVNERALSFEPVAYEAGKSIETHIDENICVRGDADQLKQLTSTLLDNAVKYADRDTTVLVELLTIGKKNALLRVADIGPEISPEDQKKIFTRFYRADVSREANGSYGLGLSIAKGIAERHGGSIAVQSKDGCTAFSVTLPLIK